MCCEKTKDCEGKVICDGKEIATIKCGDGKIAFTLTEAGKKICNCL